MIGKIISIFNESTRTFEDQEKGETVVLLLRRHPFVALLPISALLIFAVIPLLAFMAFYSNIIHSKYAYLALFVGSIYYMVLWLIAFYYLMMYTLNTVIITDKRIIDRDQIGFFNRKVSELHLYRVQDITVETKGILPTLIRYGDIIVQTAGVEQKFVFRQIPKPEAVRASIMKVVSMANAGVKPAVDK